MKRFDINRRCEVESLKADAFMAEIERVCRSHRMVLSYDEFEQGYVVGEFTEQAWGMLNGTMLGNPPAPDLTWQLSRLTPNLTPKQPKA